MKIPNHLTVKGGVLYVGDIAVTDLATRFGTPLYVYDANLLRQTARTYREGLANEGFQTRVVYASKAASFVALLKLFAEEGMALDVVSDGELYTARAAGFPMERVVFHGNNKTTEELMMALSEGVGTIVLDNLQEASRLSQLATEQEKNVNVLVRLNPGIDAHTHAYIQTATSDSKFGIPLANDEAKEALMEINKMPGLRLRGIHCHIGSQIFAGESFEKAAITMLSVMAEFNQCGMDLTILDLGGGFGVYYAEGDEPFEVGPFLKKLSQLVASEAAKRGLKLDEFWIEPGRSLVNTAGLTLYRVGDVKQLADGVNHCFIDGGMGDNLRPALYQSQYEACLANRVDDPNEGLWRISGKYCESGDILIRDLPLPLPKRDDIVSIFGTGAYCFSMFSEYNRLKRPAVVFVDGKNAVEVVRRERVEDIISLDVQ